MVPLDHFNVSGPQIPVAVVRYKSAEPEPKGTILFNPGGPGGSGVIVVKLGGENLMNVFGGKHDILGFDPRGIGASHPVLCFESAVAHNSFDSASKDLGVPGIPGSFISKEAYAARVETGSLACKKNVGEFLKYVSTASTARDMDLIRESLGEEKMTYFGVSYGT
jgi:pimeloyl-ACP methyl ester carboxylesterase